MTKRARFLCDNENLKINYVIKMRKKIFLLALLLVLSAMFLAPAGSAQLQGVQTISVADVDAGGENSQGVQEIGQSSGSFLDEYFIDPLVHGTGYNIVNTTVFAIILIAAVLVVYKLIRILKISIDRRFFLGIVPFVLMGGVLRAFQDFTEATGGVRNFLFITPGIYITVFAVALVALLVSIAVARVSKGKIEYQKLWALIGIVAVLAVLSQMNFTNAFAFWAVVLISAIWAVLLLAIKKLSRNREGLQKFLSAENMFVIFVHLFDATTTFVAVAYLGYFEQHVLPGFLTSIIGPAAIFVLKIIVVPIVLYLFDRELTEKDAEKNVFLKIVVMILGLGPGLRNFVRMVAGV